MITLNQVEPLEQRIGIRVAYVDRPGALGCLQSSVQGLLRRLRPAKSDISPMGPTDAEPRGQEVWIKLDRPCKNLACLCLALCRPLLTICVRLDRQVPGLQAVGWWSHDGRFLAFAEHDVQRNGDIECDVILNGEDVGHSPFVCFCPEVPSR